MPGLAAAGFKPAVYTNFTTLANRRMILEDRTVLIASAGILRAGIMLDFAHNIAAVVTIAVIKK